MSLFTVDVTKCNHDGICVENCPTQIIVLDEDHQVPIPSKDAEEICINCGHCVSVCPTGALSLSTMTPKDCQPLQRELLPRPEQVEHLLRSRRSIRTYTDQMIDRKLLTHLLHVASYAPTGSNRQPVEWHIIYDSDDVQHLASLVINWMRNTKQYNRLVADWDSGIDRICRNAPHVVVAHAPKDHGSASTSCNIALTSACEKRLYNNDSSYKITSNRRVISLFLISIVLINIGFFTYIYLNLQTQFTDFEVQ